MSLKPRDYQLEALDAILKAYHEGIINETTGKIERRNRGLICLPTGSGKTIIFGMLIKELKVRTLVLAHREELLKQAEQKIKMVYPEADTGILQSQELSGLEAEICIASVQTAVNHIKELRARNFNLCICDEAHHAAASSYIKIFKELDFLTNEFKTKLLIGVTATGYRSDKLGLAHIFGEKPLFERSIAAMQRGRYLCKARAVEIATNADISDVKISRGDFSIGGLSVVVDTPERNELIVNKYLEIGEERHGVVFCVSVAHAFHVAEKFKQRGVACEAVWGNMPSDLRREVLEAYESGEIKILTNVGVLTEGWDVPDTDIIMMARPTYSTGLYVQCIGRGLRKAFGKEDCLILDFVDIVRRHDICKFASLRGFNPVKDEELEDEELEDEELEDEELEDELEKEKEAKIRKERTAKISNFKNGEIDLTSSLEFAWQKMPDGSWKLLMRDNSSLWCMKVDGGYEALLMQPDGSIKKLSDLVLQLDYAYGVCEDYARKNRGAKFARKDAPWRELPATEKQINALRGANIEIKENITRGEACDLLSQNINKQMITEKQLYFIEKNNLHKKPEVLTKYEASRLISAFKEQESA